MKLIVNELTEFLVPHVFIIAFFIAYEGPNAGIIGNVQNNYWQYHKVENLKSYAFDLILMTVIDVSSAIVSITLVWKLCKIDCWLFIRNKIFKL